MRFCSPESLTGDWHYLRFSKYDFLSLAISCLIARKRTCPLTWRMSNRKTTLPVLGTSKTMVMDHLTTLVFFLRDRKGRSCHIVIFITLLSLVNLRRLSKSPSLSPGLGISGWQRIKDEVCKRSPILFAPLCFSNKLALV